MIGSQPISRQELLGQLSEAIAAWETSPYFLADEELFDLERFLVDHDAEDLLRELEQIYGRPLNQKFWSSSLAYHKLKKARQLVKEQDASQDEKRRQYLEAVTASRREWQAWIKDWAHQLRRQQIRIVRPGETPATRE